MTIFQNDGSCNVWRLDASELKFISPYLKKIYQNFSLDYTKNKSLTDEDINEFYNLDKSMNTSFIPHFTIVKETYERDELPMPHITLKVGRVKIHWGWGVEPGKGKYANFKLWISKNPENIQIDVKSIDFYCEKIFRILGCIIPSDGYSLLYQCAKMYVNNLQTLVFEFNNIRLMKIGMLHEIVYDELPENDILLLEKWICRYVFK